MAANAGAFPAAAGYPQQSGITIPLVFAKKFRFNLYDYCVVPAISNTDYGKNELQKGANGAGDTIRIRTTSPITTFEYVKGGPMPTNFLSPGYFDMPVNENTAFIFQVDDIDILQTDMALMAEHATVAAKESKIAIDTKVLANIYADADTHNAGLTAGAITGGYNLGVSGTPFGLTKANVIDKLVDCVSALQENKVTLDDHPWAVIPVWVANLLQKSDIKDAAMMGDSVSVARNGRIGMVAGIELFVSNLLHYGTSGAFTAFDIPFGIKRGLSFYAQLDGQVSTGDAGVNGFYKYCKGLTVYGYKVIHSACIGHLHAYNAT